jgi:hypothetical protein
MESVELEQLRDDIRVLQTMIDAALDSGGGLQLLEACAYILRDRCEKLERLEDVAKHDRAV